MTNNCCYYSFVHDHRGRSDDIVSYISVPEGRSFCSQSVTCAGNATLCFHGVVISLEDGSEYQFTFPHNIRDVVEIRSMSKELVRIGVVGIFVNSKDITVGQKYLIPRSMPGLFVEPFKSIRRFNFDE